MSAFHCYVIISSIQARSQTKISEGAKLFAMKSTRQGSNVGELQYPKYIGCKAKRQRVQGDGGAADGVIAFNAPAWLRAWVQNNFRITSGARYYCHLERGISTAWALRDSITSGARCWCHLGRGISEVWALRDSITSGARCWCHLGRGISEAWALRHSITSGARCWCHLGRKISIAWALRYSITSGARCWCHLGSNIPIKRISIAWAQDQQPDRCSQAGSQAKIPLYAKSFSMKSTRQGSNDGELLYPKYTGCKAKRQRVQWDA